MNWRWRQLPWEFAGVLPVPELPVDSEGRSKQCRHPAGSNCCQHHPPGCCCCSCCSLTGMLLLPNPCGHLPGKVHFPKPARAEDFLWCAERGTLQEQWVSTHFLVGWTSCSAPGSCAAFCSVWVSKLFDYSSVLGQRERISLYGEFILRCPGLFFSFLHWFCYCECFGSRSQTQLWPYALC